MAQIIDLRKATKSFQPLLEAAEALSKKDLPATRHAMRRAAAYVEQTWLRFASGAPVPGTGRDVTMLNLGPRLLQDYRNGVGKVPLGKFDWLIFNGSGKVADWVEDGIPRRDLKVEVTTWPRRKIAKEGHAYAHIPFRHKAASVKAQMPRVRVSQTQVKALTRMTKSMVTGFRKDARGVRRAVYQWADRVKHDRKLRTPTRFAGMVRMETSTGRARSSTYMTFRTVSAANSPAGSWVIPQKPGFAMVSTIIRETEAEVGRIVRQGIDEDIGIL